MVRLRRISRRLSEGSRLLIRRSRLLRAVALVALAFCTSAVADRNPGHIETVVVRQPTVSAIEQGPLWVSKATWDRAEERLIVADPGSGRIYVYDPSGRILRRVANPGRGSLEFTKPNYSARVGDRYLIATSMNQWVSFDENLVAKSAWALDWEEGQSPYSQLATSEFDFSSTHLYAIGAAMAFDGQWSDRAIFAVALGDRSAKRVGGLSKDDDEISYYREPPFNLAVCSGRVWLLQMASTVSIVEVQDGGKRLRSFPPVFQKRPAIPLLVNADTVASRHAALRHATVADGLFCVDDRVLLLLTHRPRAGGGLQWLVYPIEPSLDVAARPIELPTTAGEIVFVPGRKRWAVLEKGPMKYPGVQPLTRLISFARPVSTPVKAGAAP